MCRRSRWNVRRHWRASPCRVAVAERLVEKQRHKEMLRSMLLGQIESQTQIDRGNIRKLTVGARPEKQPDTAQGETADLPIGSSRAVTSSQASDAFARYFSN